MEEIVNSVTHGVALLLSVAGIALLIVLGSLKGDVWRLVSFSVYGVTLIILYTASTLYHSLHATRAKDVLRVIDHSAIYLLIAGSYTPFALVSLRGGWGWSIFGVTWLLAIMGIAVKIFYMKKSLFISTAFYLAMGWLAVIAIRPVLQRLPAKGVAWLLAGGACYSIGAIFHFFKKTAFMHSIWHVFVMAGSICHYFAVLFYVLPM
ncbi:MAG: hemolysin III family protein [Candidatus Omnitrophota bacterium]